MQISPNFIFYLSASPPPALPTTVGGRRPPPASPTATRGAATTLWTHSTSRWTSPSLATPPRRAPRPPPRRRRGQLAAEPQLPNSRAAQYQEQSCFIFPSLPRPLPAQNPQNIAFSSARMPAKLKLTVAPHLQTTSARADPTNSSALSSRSSPTPPRHLFSTGATSPLFPELRPPFFSASVALLAVDHLAPTIPDPSKHTIRCALTSSYSHASPPSPPVMSLAGIRPVKPLPSL